MEDDAVGGTPSDNNYERVQEIISLIAKNLKPIPLDALRFSQVGFNTDTLSSRFIPSTLFTDFRQNVTKRDCSPPHNAPPMTSSRGLTAGTRKK